MDIVIGLLLIALAAVAYMQVNVTLLDEFEFINGPITYLPTGHSTDPVCVYSQVVVRAELDKGSKLTVAYFKAPLFFKDITPCKQQSLLKRSARINGVRIGTINQIDYVR